MNRRQFLRTTALASTALASTALALAPRRTLASVNPKSAIRNPKSRKPNLLFIMTDQQRWDTLACYGNTTIDAPALNTLATQSVIFDTAIVAHPVCTPSRGCMMTGLWPHQTGVTANNINLPAATPCYPELLADPDYRTAHIGKWHLGDELFPQHGFEEWTGTEDQYQDHFTPARDKNTKSHYWHYLADELGLKPGKNGYFSREFACKQPIENGKPAYQARRAIDFLRRNKNNPFILHVSYLEPHTPFISPLKKIYNPAPLPPPESYYKRHDHPDTRSWRVRMRQDYFAHTNTYGAPPEKLSEITRHYYGNISVVDRSVGKILAELERLDLADNTIVVFTSDHGEMMGAHGLWFKEVMHHEAMRVPMLVRHPGARGGTRITAPWSHADLTPTLLGLLNKKAPAHLPPLPGRDRSAEIRGEATPAQTIYSQWSPNGEDDNASPAAKKRVIDPKKDPKHALAAANPELVKYVYASNRCAISPDGWKLTLSDTDIPELYNIRQDPQELTNQYKNPAHRETTRRLTADLHRWQERTNDKLKLAS